MAGGNRSHILSQENPDAMRRNLKTAGGVGMINIENELFAKDIMYKASLDTNPAILSKDP